jgi:hypothetical protein
MPIYEYVCPDGHKTSSIEKVGVKTLLCRVCALEAHLTPSVPSFKLSWVPTVCDSAKDIWEGTPLEGTDGVNELQYEYKKLFSLTTSKKKKGTIAKAISQL